MDAPSGGDFTSSQPGRALTSLAARGSALVAELKRLAPRAPPACCHVHASGKKKRPVEGDAADAASAARYAPVVEDFGYFKVAEYFESRVEGDEALARLDDEFRDAHFGILARFYALFAGVATYHADVVQVLEQLHAGDFIGYSLEGVLQGAEGKQLLVEVAHLLGVLLLLLDWLLPGTTRERLVVSYVRYYGLEQAEGLDDVVALCRATGYLPAEASPSGAQKRPAGYPQEYLARFALPRAFVRMAVARLRTDDVYNLVQYYPAPEHRSTALAAQSSCLFVILFFAPDILSNEAATMREIVDKHFVDMWVVPLYVGHTVDVGMWWEPYKAASAAIAMAAPPIRARELAEAHAARLPRLRRELGALLAHGALTDEYVLEAADSVLGCLRAANATVRWLFLHSGAAAVHKKRREAVLRGLREKRLPDDAVLFTLMDCARLENALREALGRLLESRGGEWERERAQAQARMAELGQFFEGGTVLGKDVKDANLSRYFAKMASSVGDLDLDKPVAAGRKIQLLSAALEEVEHFHQMEASLLCRQHLEETRRHLGRMVRVANVQRGALVALSVVGDASYAWGLLEPSTPRLHELVRRDPTSTTALRCLFLKVRSVLEAPLLRGAQCEHPDLYSTTEYYSGELAAYVRSVLAAVPQAIFSVVLGAAFSSQAARVLALPARLEKARLREEAKAGFEDRLEMARATARVAALAKGVREMEVTFVGVVRLDPKELLQDGVRSQLVAHLVEALSEGLRPDEREAKGKAPPPVSAAAAHALQARLDTLAARTATLRVSLECVQDFVGVRGLDMWHKELARVVGYAVERQTNPYLSAPVLDWQSGYQSAEAPIPPMPVLDTFGFNFMGRLAHELLRLSDPLRFDFWPQRAAWHDLTEARARGLNQATLRSVRRAVGVPGLEGVNRILGFMAARYVRVMAQRIEQATTTLAAREALEVFRESLEPITGTPTRGATHYAEAINLLSRLLSSSQASASIFASTVEKGLLAELRSSLANLGQLALLRRAVAAELASACALDSSALMGAADALNEGLMADVRAHYNDPVAWPYPGDDVSSGGEAGGEAGGGMGECGGEPAPQTENSGGGGEGSPEEEEGEEEEMGLLPMLTRLLEATGQSDPMDKVYSPIEPLDALPVLLFLASAAAVRPREGGGGAYVLDARAERLARADARSRAGRGAPDAAAFCAGVATMLKQTHEAHTRRYLLLMAQYQRALGSDCGMAAREAEQSHRAGLGKEGALLTGEACASAMLLREVCRIGKLPQDVVEAALPPFAAAAALAPLAVDA